MSAPAIMASTNKCLAQSNKSRTRSKATKKREIEGAPPAPEKRTGSRAAGLTVVKLSAWSLT